MKKHIVCLGDSNTHGYCADPRDAADGGDRFNENERWTCLLQQRLGEDYLVLEEGLSGRTTVFDDPIDEGLSALPYLVPCLMSHEPVDLLILMLGTNDTKDRFAVTPECIARGMDRLVQTARCTDCWGGKEPRILVIAPPPIGEQMTCSEVMPVMGVHCPGKSRQLGECYRAHCQALGTPFLDAGQLGCEFNCVDYMHLTARGHARLAEVLAQRVPQLLHQS